MKLLPQLISWWTTMSIATLGGFAAANGWSWVWFERVRRMLIDSSWEGRLTTGDAERCAELAYAVPISTETMHDIKGRLLTLQGWPIACWPESWDQWLRAGMAGAAVSAIATIAIWIAPLLLSRSPRFAYSWRSAANDQTIIGTGTAQTALKRFQQRGALLLLFLAGTIGASCWFLTADRSLTFSPALGTDYAGRFFPSFVQIAVIAIMSVFAFVPAMVLLAASTFRQSVGHVSLEAYRLCAKCRYELRGLEREACLVCPECGERISRENGKSAVCTIASTLTYIPGFRPLMCAITVVVPSTVVIWVLVCAILANGSLGEAMQPSKAIARGSMDWLTFRQSNVSRGGAHANGRPYFLSPFGTAILIETDDAEVAVWVERLPNAKPPASNSNFAHHPCVFACATAERGRQVVGAGVRSGYSESPKKGPTKPHETDLTHTGDTTVSADFAPFGPHMPRHRLFVEGTLRRIRPLNPALPKDRQFLELLDTARIQAWNTRPAVDDSK